MKRALLITGAPLSCRLAIKTLQRDSALAGAEILTRFQARDAAALLQSRTDIGLVIVIWDGGDHAELPQVAASLIGARRDARAAVVVRAREPLAADIADELWRLGTADRLFMQSIESRDLACSVAAILRSNARMDALVGVADASARLEKAETLSELSGLVLSTLHDEGIGRGGGLFCQLGGSAEQRLMIVGGTGRYGDAECRPLDRWEDRRVAASIDQALKWRHSIFAPDEAVLYIQTADGDVSCIYLALDTSLLPWQYDLIHVLMRAFSVAIGKNQAAQRVLRTQHATISTMATLAEYRDVDTGEHVARVARTVTEIAHFMAERGDVADVDMVGQIGLAAILHDIGKIAVPEAMLLKPGPLDAAERQVMEKHALLGRHILLQAARRSDNAELLRLAAEIAHHHHEKYDGTGYPDGLKGGAIPLAARIVALVDVFDALTNRRPYKEAWPVERALETIRDGSGSHFDPRVVEAFLLLEERRKSARFFVWSEPMSVGHADLDLDHKRLVAIIDRLWFAERDGNRQVIEFILDDLVHYTESHFQREETIMRQGGYPDLERHCAIHERICRRLEEIRWEYFQGIREGLGGEILEFLKQWLNKHILGEDMSYRPYLQAVPTMSRPHAPIPEPELVT